MGGAGVGPDPYLNNLNNRSQRVLLKTQNMNLNVKAFCACIGGVVGEAEASAAVAAEPKSASPYGADDGLLGAVRRSRWRVCLLWCGWRLL